MTWFSEGTAGFVYTAIRPQPVSLLCCTLLQWMHTQSLEGRSRQRSFCANHQGGQPKVFTLLKDHNWWKRWEEEVKQETRLFFSLAWKYFLRGEKSPPAVIAVRSLNKVGHTVDEEKDKLRCFETCVVPFTALRNSKRAGLHYTEAIWIYQTFIFWTPPAPKPKGFWYFF